MVARCLNPRYKHFDAYGGRGITVCDRWNPKIPGNTLAFANFIEDMGMRPIVLGKRSTLERQDNNKGYSKDNCVWADDTTQANNKRNTTYLTLNGDTDTLSNWARRLKIHPETLRNRINNYGWSVERALTTPVTTKKQ